MLSAVGNAVAVSPDIALMRAANANQWTTRGVEDHPDDPTLGPTAMTLPR